MIYAPRRSGVISREILKVGDLGNDKYKRFLLWTPVRTAEPIPLNTFLRFQGKMAALGRSRRNTESGAIRAADRRSHTASTDAPRRGARRRTHRIDSSSSRLPRCLLAGPSRRRSSARDPSEPTARKGHLFPHTRHRLAAQGLGHGSRGAKGRARPPRLRAQVKRRPEALVSRGSRHGRGRCRLRRPEDRPRRRQLRREPRPRSLSLRFPGWRQLMRVLHSPAIPWRRRWPPRSSSSGSCPTRELTPAAFLRAPLPACSRHRARPRGPRGRAARRRCSRPTTIRCAPGRGRRRGGATPGVGGEMAGATYNRKDKRCAALSAHHHRVFPPARRVRRAPTRPPRANFSRGSIDRRRHSRREPFVSPKNKLAFNTVLLHPGRGIRSLSSPSKRSSNPPN